jgi:glycosyltransferase involved in cell wall biosynthesis
MKVKYVACWYNTSYAEYVDCLRKALQRQGSEVGVIASNCGCSDPMNGVFFDRSCDFFEYPNLTNWRSRYAVKRWALGAARNSIYGQRAKLYMQRSGDADVLHFQQTLNAYGSLALFKWLKRPSAAARVVTVHELDGYQTDYPELNRAYNLADCVLVHAQSLKRELVALGVEAHRIEFIHHGVDPQPPSAEPRSGIILYGGHNLNPSKGLETMADAMILMRKQLGERSPRLKMYGYYGDATLEYGKRVFADAGLADQVDWLGRLSLTDMTREFQRSLACVQPFTGSFAGLAVTLAMANDVPVIGTRFAAIPEHVGDAGIIVPEKSPTALAEAIVRVVEDAELRGRLSAAGRRRVHSTLSWDEVARATLDVYRRAIANRAARAA